jgi:fucose 4-O-acetylase-like acetyltransferase
VVAFDYFRAIAILIIIAGHSNVPWHINTLAEKMLVIMVKGGTSLFVFVSGFFLCYRYAKDFSLSTFMAAKTKFVLLPYVIITTLGYAFYLWSDADLPFYQLSGSGLPNILWDHVWDHAQLLGTYLLYGKISGAY